MNTRNRVKDFAGFCLPLLRPFRFQLAGALLAVGIAAALTVMGPWPLKVVIDRVLNHKHTRVPLLNAWLNNPALDPLHILYGACAATLLIALGAALLRYFYRRTMGAVGQRFVFALRGNLFAHMQRLSLQFHDHQRIGDLTARLTSDIQAVRTFIANGLIQLVSNGCLLLGMAAMMFWLNWQFALVTLSVAPLLFWMVIGFTRQMRAATRAARTSDGLLASVAQETLASIRIVQGLAQEEQQDERFLAQSENSLNAYLESNRYQARLGPLVDVLAAAALALVMWFGATRVLAHQLTVGDVVVFFAYVTSFYAPIRALARLLSNFTRASVGAERISEVLQQRSEVRQHKNARPAPPFRGAVEFRDVWFEFESNEPVLAEINLHVRPGEKVALVGTTGAGKSTLASLIPRLYDPVAGSVCIDGCDIRNFTVQSVRAQIGFVLQDSLLFKGSIRDNIAFGRPEATEEEIIAAAVAAHADEFIRRLPKAYETHVAEGGTTISGGQKQRIAIARAVLRQAPILILDEPTSGLDAASERLVMDALQRAAAGRTTLLIAHRLATARIADRIVVLDHGRIVEEGSHAELLAQQGRYAHLYDLQFGTEPRSAQPARLMPLLSAPLPQ